VWRIGLKKTPENSHIQLMSLRSLRSLMPDWTTRRIADNARAGRIPGAKKVGRDWMMSVDAFERWIGRAPAANDGGDEMDMRVQLRKRGLI
jgi:hypothetical protein